MSKGNSNRGPYTSNKERPNVSKSIRKAMKNARHPSDRMMNQYDAHMKGKYTKLTKDDTKHTGVYVRKPGAKAEKTRPVEEA